jgi:hypothetical protein
MTWMDDVRRELLRARDAEHSGNSGRARTAARRAVGLAIAELQRQHPEKVYGQDFILQLRSFGLDPEIPLAAREAAGRLQARLTRDFQSSSVNPLDDANIVIAFVLSRLE